jgi:aminomethyltransferase
MGIVLGAFFFSLSNYLHIQLLCGSKYILQRNEMKKTSLYDPHVTAGAKFVEFFGWEMPIEYSGIIQEHMAVRQNAGLFDVSHMGEILISGTQALDFVQYLTPNNAARLDMNKAQYSALTTPQGTFVDDLLVYFLYENQYLLVVNAANTDKDFQWILSHKKGFDVEVYNQSENYTQMALQGPEAQKILSSLTEIELEGMSSFAVERGSVAGEDAIVSRTGYTGEDGFEIYTLSTNPRKIWDAIMDEGKAYGLLPIGLGARDTLRLEATLMLYGNDIDENTTVLEAGLRWLIKFKKGDFLGREALLKQKEEGISRKIVGFELIGKGIARPHYPVFLDDEKVGEVRSGSFSPFLHKSIGLTYLPIEHTEVGTEFAIEIRGNQIEAKVVPTPFYKKENTK